MDRHSRAERERNAASENIARSLAQLGAGALHHRRDSSTADGPAEPDFRVRPRQTRAPSICGRFARIVLAPSQNATPRHPSGARKRTADGSAHTAHRCAFSVRQRLGDRSIIALASRNGGALHREHTKLNTKRARRQRRSVRGRPSGAPAYHHRAGRARMREVQQEWNPTIVSQGRAATDEKTRIVALFSAGDLEREKNDARSGSHPPTALPLRRRRAAAPSSLFCEVLRRP